jgi:hypothetical protein
MRPKAPLAVALFALASLTLPHLAHASIPFLGPIIPQAGVQSTCAAGWGMLIVVINNIIQFLITIAISFVAPIMIAYAGFLFVVNPVNAGGKERAKSILTNTIVGIVISLSAWLVVDAVMAVLYTSPSDTRGAWGAWTDLITTNDAFCAPQTGSLPGDVLNQVTAAPILQSSGGAVTAGGKFEFQNSAIAAQAPDESPALASLLTCMTSFLPAKVIITSISDEAIRNGKSFDQCRAGGCAHAANSCHYGGRNCLGSSYAADLKGDSGLIVSAAQTCGASVLNEGSHVHVSVGAKNNCGCDSRFD